MYKDLDTKAPAFPTLLDEAIKPHFETSSIGKKRKADVKLLKAHKQNAKTPQEIKRFNETINAIENGTRVYGVES